MWVFTKITKYLLLIIFLISIPARVSSSPQLSFKQKLIQYERLLEKHFKLTKGTLRTVRKIEGHRTNQVVYLKNGSCDVGLYAIHIPNCDKDNKAAQWFIETMKNPWAAAARSAEILRNSSLLCKNNKKCTCKYHYYNPGSNGRWCRKYNEIQNRS